MVAPSDFFQCQMCGECCKGYGGAFVTERDIDAISRHLNMGPESFLRDYCQWSGGRPLIKSSESGYCVFWDEVCTIHAVKPRMCKVWPFIGSILADVANWDVIQSVCPGVRRKGRWEDLIDCVKQVQAQYEKEQKGFEL